jgi:hypothetical protein
LLLSEGADSGLLSVQLLLLLFFLLLLLCLLNMSPKEQLIENASFGKCRPYRAVPFY